MRFPVQEKDFQSVLTVDSYADVEGNRTHVELISIQTFANNLNEIKSVFIHRCLYFLTLFFRNTICFGCHQPSSGVGNPKLRHRFKKQILKTTLIVV
jgi:hypothetical protein